SLQRDRLTGFRDEALGSEAPAIPSKPVGPRTRSGPHRRPGRVLYVVDFCSNGLIALLSISTLLQLSSKHAFLGLFSEIG
uniref:Solute carrier family 40 protein n=1 Tax=Macrostomum lignano TaxID=282301 RepID=A0A1I8HLZ8_9PLAT